MLTGSDLGTLHQSLATCVVSVGASTQTRLNSSFPASESGRARESLFYKRLGGTYQLQM